MQLRRPSDGAISDPRPFEFLPLDGGRGFWAAKRMKTNYNIFSNILAIGNQPRLATTSMEVDGEDQQPTRRKVPSASNSPLLTSPGFSPRIPAPNSLASVQVIPASGVPPPPPPPPPPPLPAIPSSQVLQRSSAGYFDDRPLRVPPKGAAVNLRPISAASDVSSVSSASTGTTVTGRSINDILSLADGADDDERRRESVLSDFDIPSSPTENVSIQQLMMTSSANLRQQLSQQQQLQLLANHLAAGQQPQVVAVVQQPHAAVAQQPSAVMVIQQPAQQQQQQLQLQQRLQQLQPLAVQPPAKTAQLVKPVLLADKPVKHEEVKTEIELMDIDAYDEVLQIVYDDVDTKYDVVQLAAPETTPPVPPVRRQRTAESLTRPAPPTPETEKSPEEEKPLPETPSKVPTILAKFSGSGKKNAKEVEEQKKREKAEKEAERLREKEEKEREKEEREREKAAKKQEELEKKKKKKSKTEEENLTSPRQSLFQRLFSK